MRRKKIIAVSCILLSMAGGSCWNDNHNFNGKPPDPQPKTAVALVFCDVTNSLTSNENKKVASLAADIIDLLPERTIYRLYPIQIQTQLPSPLKLDVNENNGLDDDEYIVPEVVSNTKKDEYDEFKKKRRKLIETEIEALYQNLNKIPDDNRTCILNALGFASGYLLRDFRDESRYDLEIYLISDMIEECNNTPLRSRRIEMDRQNISREIKQAGTMPDGCALGHVQITCIFPTTVDTSGVPLSRRPNRDDVKKFWTLIFKRCGFKDEDFQTGRISWVDDGTIPARLTSRANN